MSFLSEQSWIKLPTNISSMFISSFSIKKLNSWIVQFSVHLWRFCVSSQSACRGSYLSHIRKIEGSATSPGSPWPYKLERSIKEMNDYWEVLSRYCSFLLCEQGKDAGGEDTNWFWTQASFHPQGWCRFCALGQAHSETDWRAGKLVDLNLEDTWSVANDGKLSFCVGGEGPS